MKKLIPIIILITISLALQAQQTTQTQRHITAADYLVIAGNQRIGAISCYVSAVLIGAAQIGIAHDNDDYDPTGAYVLTGSLLIIGTYLDVRSAINIKRAGRYMEHEIKLGLTQSGVGLQVKF